MSIAQAVKSLQPNSEFIIENEDYSTVIWIIEPETIPTQAEVDAEVTRLQADYDSKQFQRDRAEAYPSLTEQADMAYWDRQNGTTTLDDAISAVKAKFPKG